MRIVHTESSRGWGGQEIRILSEARGMLRRGHSVLLLCPADARIHSEAARFGVSVTALPIGDKGLRGILSLRRWLRQAQRTGPPDIINTHSSTDSWLAALACASLRQAPALVRTRHISAPVPDNLTTGWLYRHASRMVVTTGETLRQTLLSVNHLDAARVVSIPTGIDTNLFQPASAGQREQARARMHVTRETFVVGIVATLRSWKGHRYLIEALGMMAARASARPLHLVIVGDGPQRAHLEAQVAHQGLQSVVQFCGNQNSVVEWLHGMDAFALPSYANEGIPQALLQAMACALPVVTTQAGAIGEIARDSETALVVAPRDAAALAAALERLAGDEELARTLGHRAHELVRARHGEDVMLDKMEAVFKGALAGAPTANQTAVRP